MTGDSRARLPAMAGHPGPAQRTIDNGFLFIRHAGAQMQMFEPVRCRCSARLRSAESRWIVLFLHLNHEWDSPWPQRDRESSPRECARDTVARCP
jgi:hypothetical protein